MTARCSIEAVPPCGAAQVVLAGIAGMHTVAWAGAWPRMEPVAGGVLQPYANGAHFRPRPDRSSGTMRCDSGDTIRPRGRCDL